MQSNMILQIIARGRLPENMLHDYMYWLAFREHLTDLTIERLVALATRNSTIEPTKLDAQVNQIFEDMYNFRGDEMRANNAR